MSSVYVLKVCHTSSSRHPVVFTEVFGTHAKAKQAFDNAIKEFLEDNFNPMGVIEDRDGFFTVEIPCGEFQTDYFSACYGEYMVQ